MYVPNVYIYMCMCVFIDAYVWGMYVPVYVCVMCAHMCVSICGVCVVLCTCVCVCAYVLMCVYLYGVCVCVWPPETEKALSTLCPYSETISGAFSSAFPQGHIM